MLSFFLWFSFNSFYDFTFILSMILLSFFLFMILLSFFLWFCFHSFYDSAFILSMILLPFFLWFCFHSFYDIAFILSMILLSFFLWFCFHSFFLWFWFSYVYYIAFIITMIFLYFFHLFAQILSRILLKYCLEPCFTFIKEKCYNCLFICFAFQCHFITLFFKKVQLKLLWVTCGEWFGNRIATQ